MIWLGVDGGATKTEALVVENNQVKGFSRMGPSNHQVTGLDDAIREIGRAIDEAMRIAEIELSQIDHAVLGLAGADFPQDVTRLKEGLKLYFGQTSFSVVNDAEIALYAGTDKGWGICAVAGTGGNVFGRTLQGVSRQVGGLGYEFGDHGSGIDLVKDVLHHAFRSAERRGPKTKLEQLVLDVLGFSDYSRLSWAMYDHQVPDMTFFVLAPLCFQAAAAGDPVAIGILARQGRSIGDSIVGCARLLELDHDAVDVVLAGSLWHGAASTMRDALEDVLGGSLPRAKVFVTELRPVAGAVLMAAAGFGNTQTLRTSLRHDARFIGVE